MLCLLHSFPALDSLIDELSRAMAAGLRQAEAGARLAFIAELRASFAAQQVESSSEQTVQRRAHEPTNHYLY